MTGPACLSEVHGQTSPRCAHCGNLRPEHVNSISEDTELDLMTETMLTAIAAARALWDRDADAQKQATQMIAEQPPAAMTTSLVMVAVDLAVRLADATGRNPHDVFDELIEAQLNGAQ